MQAPQPSLTDEAPEISHQVLLPFFASLTCQVLFFFTLLFLLWLFHLILQLFFISSFYLDSSYGHWIISLLVSHSYFLMGMPCSDWGLIF